MLLAVLFVLSVAALAHAQSDELRPMRRVETEDGVIVLTNSTEREPALDSKGAEPSSEEDEESYESAEADGDRFQRQAHALRPTLASKVTAPERSAVPSWWVPLVVVFACIGACVWGFRRKRAEAVSRGGTSESFDVEDVLDTDVIEEPLDSAAAGQWALAVRDSVPPSAPPRSRPPASGPQWLSQPPRTKPDES